MRKRKKNGVIQKVTIFDVFLYILMGLLALIMAFPFYYMVIVSFSDYETLHSQTLYIWPKIFDTSAYKLVLENSQFWGSVLITVFITVVGTFLGVVFSVAAAYPLTKKEVPGSKALFNIMIFTMFFGGGMIPGYLVVQQLGLGNSIWCMIWPSLLAPFYIILIKNFIEELPASIEESAKIDGANDMVILFRIILPMSKPIVATIALFFAVSKWNEYYSAMLNIIDTNKYPLQLLLRGILLDTTNTLTGTAATVASTNKQIYSLSLQMAIVTIATVPILVVYPFVQKYFTKGIMLGGVKG